MTEIEDTGLHHLQLSQKLLPHHHLGKETEKKQGKCSIYSSM
jgi:hypothetical protein